MKHLRSGRRIRPRGLAAAGLVCAKLSCGRSDVPTPTNVIVISVDTLRADHMSLHGYARRTTPRIERSLKKRSPLIVPELPGPRPSRAWSRCSPVVPRTSPA